MKKMKKIIMDVDTGSDDAVALTLAMSDPDIDLLGICTVNGNIEAALTTDNTLRVVECCDAQDRVKVYRGCEYPLVCTLQRGTPQYGVIPKRKEDVSEKLIHRKTLPLPEPAIREQRESAVSWLISTLLESEGDIVLVAVGPLTNIAAAMRADVRIVDKISEIIIMGGGHERSGLCSPAAEFNVWCDPEAMEIVLQSGCKITMIPLDATYHAKLGKKEAEEIAAIGTPRARLVSDLILQRIEGYVNGYGEEAVKDGVPVHDALAVCSALYPQVLRDVKLCNMHVDLGKGYAYGRTVIDTRDCEYSEPANIAFAMGADRELFSKWVIDTLKKSV